MNPSRHFPIRAAESDRGIIGFTKTPYGLSVNGEAKGSGPGPFGRRFLSAAVNSQRDNQKCSSARRRRPPRPDRVHSPPRESPSAADRRAVTALQLSSSRIVENSGRCRFVLLYL
ncbi:hypothetical protein GWI33_004939 [Rhynchophorus ferrugineus]|uniref:Uncharacterized protein n=1 Tax=Rhynchophorus ferrugineus TaxID=354439 RepID=A0A834IUY6_RHYFE|nr:hypothetical protein GWI33_004939 [Rhynchophorus ferrugineus]